MNKIKKRISNWININFIMEQYKRKYKGNMEAMNAKWRKQRTEKRQEHWRWKKERKVKKENNEEIQGVRKEKNKERMKEETLKEKVWLSIDKWKNNAINKKEKIYKPFLLSDKENKMIKMCKGTDMNYEVYWEKKISKYIIKRRKI